jgi:hypothetical protein
VVSLQKKAELAPRFFASGVEKGWLASSLTPVAFDQDPTAIPMFPAMGNPDCAGMGWMRPIAFDPNVAMAVPAVIAGNPNPAGMRRMIVDLHDGRGRRDADDNSNLRQSGRGSHAKSKQQ